MEPPENTPVEQPEKPVVARKKPGPKPKAVAKEPVKVESPVGVPSVVFEAPQQDEANLTDNFISSLQSAEFNEDWFNANDPTAVEGVPDGVHVRWVDPRRMNQRRAFGYEKVPPGTSIKAKAASIKDGSITLVGQDGVQPLVLMACKEEYFKKRDAERRKESRQLQEDIHKYKKRPMIADMNEGGKEISVAQYKRMYGKNR